MKLGCRDQSNRVLSITKTRQDNDVIGFIGVVYIENDIELLRSIRPGIVYDQNLTR